MKQNTSVIILIMSLVLIVIFLFIYNNKKVDRLRRQASIERAKANFILDKCANQNDVFDSVFTRNDTILFFKNGAYLGKTVIVVE